MTQFGLLGYPLGHSFSRRYFTEKFTREGIDAQYLNFELPTIEAYPDLLAAHPGLRGHNVTIPYKQQIIPYLTQLSPEAAAIGAVNVVKITPDGRRIGYNSDVIGFTRSLQPLLRPWHRRALILGTGGASRAVSYGLTRELNFEDVRFVSRKATEENLSYSSLTPEIINDYPVIINCTPCGMYPHVDECPPLPYETLTPRHLLFDLVYNPEKTLFLQRGEARGAQIKNGIEMLHLQAEASWAFWTGQ